jgi:hypothetical protein
VNVRRAALNVLLQFERWQADPDNDPYQDMLDAIEALKEAFGEESE